MERRQKRKLVTDMAKAKTSEFITYIKSKVGSAYLWGGQGETVHELIRKLAKQKGQSDASTDKMLTYLTAHGCKDVEFYDCSGLAVAYLLSVGAISGDMTADGIYRKCSKISASEARPGDMTFLLNGSGKAHHIGYIVEDATVVHALNQTRGVITESLSNRKWVYGRPDFCLEYDLGGKGQENTVDISTLQPGDQITLKSEVKGYNTAANAESKVNPTVTYPAGEYYVYKVFGNSVNITRKKGVPGAWVVL